MKNRQRANKLALKVILDFHYSILASRLQQISPKAWKTMTRYSSRKMFTDLQRNVSNSLIIWYDVVCVQMGNEITQGIFEV
ncbi:glycosyl hydrolase 53 family protein [Lactococcus cremoris]|uniref:glycosyl hydrolase 53 family protein n=1 Tax=Lactococcus lactis subsp. cremoris TaxID=1359 RepID=UPI0005829F8C|nr:hypothetical protein JL36_10095 [Lactococcus cremoris]